MSILIVDDDKIMADIFVKTLEKRGIEAYWVETGEECLELIKNGNIDLILLDYLMPSMNGDMVLKKIREDFSGVELPVVMITSKDEAADMVGIFNLGANDYLVKPLQPDVAVARIKTQLELKSLYRDSLDKREVEAINNMIVTYNHEINNPLTIATFSIDRCIRKGPTPESLEKVKEALDRIKDIVRKIDKVSTKKIEKLQYSDGQKILKLE